jgi:hypothetical protein
VGRIAGSSRVITGVVLYLLRQCKELRLEFIANQNGPTPCLIYLRTYFRSRVCTETSTSEEGLSLHADLADLSPLYGGLFQRKQCMNRSKRRSRRLALYLRSIGIQPWAEGLHAQYNALEPEQRKLARKTGRRLIKEAGSIAKTVATLTNPVVQEMRSAPLVVARTRAQAREEAFKYISRRWSALTPPCPSCRMGNGFPKRSWPTREWANEVWGRQHDRDTLRVYECPVQPGFWHLGHIHRPVDCAFTTEEISIASCQLPATPFETGGHA